MSIFAFRFRNRREPRLLAPVELLVSVLIQPVAKARRDGVAVDIEAARRRQ